MFVLMNLTHICLRCIFAPLFGMGRPTTPSQRAEDATIFVAIPQHHPLALIHAPTPRLII